MKELQSKSRVNNSYCLSLSQIMRESEISTEPGLL